jgi:hypothetical protein
MLLVIVVGAPWIAALVWAWLQRPDDGWIPPSLGARSLERLRKL